MVGNRGETKANSAIVSLALCISCPGRTHPVTKATGKAFRIWGASKFLIKHDLHPTQDHDTKRQREREGQITHTQQIQNFYWKHLANSGWERGYWFPWSCPGSGKQPGDCCPRGGEDCSGLSQLEANKEGQNTTRHGGHRNCYRRLNNRCWDHLEKNFRQ